MPFLSTPLLEGGVSFHPTASGLLILRRIGGSEVYVRVFQTVKQVAGFEQGRWVRWRSDGREMFYWRTAN
jgi:hypothetical protein